MSAVAARAEAPAVDPAPALVEARAIVRRFANGRGVGAVDLDVRAGEMVALMGRNGCGKTTLLRMLATVARPQAGRLRWNGGSAVSARSAIGLALDSALEDPGLTGRQATHFWCAQWVRDRRDVEQRTDTVLSRLGLADAADDRVASYSFGMRRRLALAAALVHDPGLALLDEPTAGLDPDGVDRLVLMLDERAREGRTTIFASNDPGFVEGAARRVVFIDEGRILHDGSPHELLAALPGVRLAEVRVDGRCDAAALRAIGGVDDVTVDGDRATVRFSGEGTVAALVAVADAPGGRLVGLHLRRPGLADCFREITGHALEGDDAR